MKERRLLIFLLTLVLIAWGIISIVSGARSENLTIYATASVQTKLLNGRAAPRKKATVEARFDYGDKLELTGEWSADHKWVEAVGGETGTVWVSIRYISERKHFTAKNVDYKEVKVRDWPINGKVHYKIKKGQTVEIEQVVLGWGKTRYGWVDLYYLEEVQE